MAIDTLIAFVGVYDDVADAEADYRLIKELHTEADLIDAYDAAVVERRADGKTRIVKKHETPTRVGGVLGGGIGLATGLVVALFPFAAVGGGLRRAQDQEQHDRGEAAGREDRGEQREHRHQNFTFTATRIQSAPSTIRTRATTIAAMPKMFVKKPS
jgi:hypothetical protein